jgi:2-polyprenyl-3-methyl-5-hydroxy-6-metoxy-1,4-benzoquinol methylase
MNPLAYDEMNEIEKYHWWFVGRRKILSHIISNIQIKKNSKILEIGCGTGGNLCMLSAFGELTAVDMSSEAVEMAKRKNVMNAEIYLGSLPNAMPNFNDKFDLICMFDVLEHIEMHNEAIRLIEKYLKDDGQIILTVPAYQWLYGKHDEHLHHKRRYCKNELLDMVLAAGYHVNKITYFNTLLFPMALIVRIYEKYFRKHGEVKELRRMNKGVNSLLKKIFASEMRVIENLTLPFGLSLLCIISKAR